MPVKKTLLTCALAAALFAGSGVATAAGATISEAGSTLVYPIASVWASHFNGAGVSTASGGSDKGIQAIIHNQVDIGASDVPMTAGQYATGSADYVQIPWALSAAGIGYNLPGVKTGLKLTGQLLAEIYTGRITAWGSPAITALNRSSAAALRRDGRITPVFRSDGSGTSYAFQRFLTDTAPSVWKLGYSGAFGGTTGISTVGDAGVADEIEQNRGTIGYLSGAYLIQQHLSVAAIANAAGNYVFPNVPNIIKAAAPNATITAQGPDFGGVAIINPPKSDRFGYPISTYSYAIVAKSDPRLASVQAFLNWVINPREGQEYGVSLDFAPLPPAIRAGDAGLISSL